MSDEERNEPLAADAGDDDIEILEIIGLDEDGEVIEFEEDETAGEDTAPEALSEAPAPGDRDRERLLRLQADFENLRKRSEKEIAEHRRYASAAVVERLLPILDNFERAIGHDATPDDDASFRQGVELIYRQLMDELKREGLKPVEAVGREFDPNVHEAVETCRSMDHPANTVIRELLKGYRFRDRLLRPALVQVNLGTTDEGGSQEGAG